MEQTWDPLRKKMVALTPEEKVRQWFIGVLRDQVKVPSYMMMSEVAMKFGQKDFRADILVYGRDTAPLMVVECKREDIEMTREVLEQALKYNIVLNSRYIAITNGRKTFGFEKVGETYQQIKAFPDWAAMQQSGEDGKRKKAMQRSGEDGKRKEAMQQSGEDENRQEAEHMNDK